MLEPTREERSGARNPLHDARILRSGAEPVEAPRDAVERTVKRIPERIDERADQKRGREGPHHRHEVERGLERVVERVVEGAVDRTCGSNRASRAHRFSCCKNKRPRERRHRAQHHAHERQDKRRQHERKRRLVRLRQLLHAAMAPEDAHGRDACDGDGDRAEDGVADLDEGQQLLRGLRAVDRILRDESEGERNARHREASEKRGGRRPRHGAAEVAEPVDDARARLVVDVARDEEERRLVEGVREKKRGDGGRGACTRQPDEENERAERRHSRPGENALQVALTEREHHRPARGERADRLQRPLPPWPRAERRVEPRHEVDAELHHRCGVKVRRHGGRRRHRVRKPEVKRHLRALRERADEDERDRGRECGRRLRRGRRGDDHGDR